MARIYNIASKDDYAYITLSARWHRKRGLRTLNEFGWYDWASYRKQLHEYFSCYPAEQTACLVAFKEWQEKVTPKKATPQEKYDAWLKRYEKKQKKISDNALKALTNVTQKRGYTAAEEETTKNKLAEYGIRMFRRQRGVKG